MAKKIFVGGSIVVRSLPFPIQKILDQKISEEASFLLGDAPGVDTLVQQYLNEKNYRNVTIYCMNNSRNNVGDWPIKTHRAPVGITGNQWHAVKDRAMDRDADEGVMIWNGKSSGTRNNILSLLEAKKSCIVQDNDKTLLYTNIEDFNAGKKVIYENKANYEKDDVGKIIMNQMNLLGETTLFDTPAKVPPIPPAGMWHKNWFSNMLPYDEPRVRADSLIAHTPEHDYQIEKTTNPIIRDMISKMGLLDKNGKPLPHEKITGHATKTFWKDIEKNGGELQLNATSLAKYGLPETWLNEHSLIVEGPERVPKYIVVEAKKRPDWNDINEAHMLDIQRHRFQPGTTWCDKLMATGRDQICEFNNWSDKNFGIDIRSGEGKNKLGVMIMTIREENRARGITSHSPNPTLPSIDQQKEPGWLLPHVTGKSDLTPLIAEIGKRLRALDPEDSNIKDPVAYKSHVYATMIGTEKTTKQEDEILFWAGFTMGISGIIVRSGAAGGADTDYEEGALAAGKYLKKYGKEPGPLVEIIHPYSRPNKGSNRPENYVFKGSHPELEKIAGEICSGINPGYERGSSFVQEMVRRDIPQEIGRDGQTPPLATFYCADRDSKTPGPNGVDGGTRYAVYTSRLLEALGFEKRPEYNLRDDRELFIKGVIEIANINREKIGKKILDATWSPENKAYKRIAEITDQIISSEPLKNDVVEKTEDQKREAQEAARRLMEVFKKEQKTFVKVNHNDPIFYGEISRRDQNIIAVFDTKTQKAYTLVDLDKVKTEKVFESGDLIEIVRNADQTISITPVHSKGKSM